MSKLDLSGIFISSFTVYCGQERSSGMSDKKKIFTESFSYDEKNK